MKRRVGGDRDLMDGERPKGRSLDLKRRGGVVGGMLVENTVEVVGRFAEVRKRRGAALILEAEVEEDESVREWGVK